MDEILQLALLPKPSLTLADSPEAGAIPTINAIGDSAAAAIHNPPGEEGTAP